jgi:hypothetical protein
MTTEKTGDLKAFAEQVKKLGAELAASYAAEELRETWRRLPNVTASPPKAAKAFAERVALYILELGDSAPKDLREFVAGSEPLRDFGPVSAAKETGSATEAQAQEGAKNEKARPDADAAADEAGPPTNSNEETTVHTQASAGRKGRKAPPAPKTSGKKAKRAAAPPRDADGKKAAATARQPRGSGPRAGSICAMVIELTKDGKSTEQVAKAIAKAHHGTEFQKKADKGDYTLVAWYRNYGRKKGWLPSNDD